MLSRLLSLFRLDTPLRRSPAEQQLVDFATQRLALYHFTTCPYCVRVKRVISRLALQIELRDAHNPTYRQELILRGGRYQTPCLRIGKTQDEAEWLYESSDIIRYLEQHFTRV